MSTTESGEAALRDLAETLAILDLDRMRHPKAQPTKQAVARRYWEARDAHRDWCRRVEEHAELEQLLA